MIQLESRWVFIEYVQFSEWSSSICRSYFSKVEITLVQTNKSRTSVIITKLSMDKSTYFCSFRPIFLIYYLKIALGTSCCRSKTICTLKFSWLENLLCVGKIYRVTSLSIFLIDLFLFAHSAIILPKVNKGSILMTIT